MTSGSPAVVYRYDIYGKTHATNDDVNNPYQYNAEYTDSTTGLQYLRARYYNSDTHRFQTKDTYQGTTAQPITRNNYAYANNNPVNFVDPSGHVGVLAAWATKVAVSGAVGGVISGGISAYTQYKSTGDISWGKVAKDAAVGAVSSAVGAAVGNSIEKKIVGKVASKVLSFVGSGIASAVTGAAERGVSTALNNRLNPSNQRQSVLKNAFDPRSMATDFVVGGLSYSVADLYSMYRNGTLKGDLYEMVADFYQNNPGCSDDMARVLDDGADVVYFGQKSVSPNFSYGGTFKGESIHSVSNKLAQGEISADSLPIEYIVRDGKKITMNNRSLTALSKANMKPTILIDVTGNAVDEKKLTQRLSEMGGHPSESILIRGTNEVVYIPN